MVKIKRDMVSAYVESVRSFGRKNKNWFIIVHQTGNTGRGANARMHSQLQKNLNPRPASWHITVDDTEAIQNFEYNVSTWQASDGEGPGNMHGISVEICINEDGDYVQAVKNGADVVAQLMRMTGLGIDKVKQHHDFYDKDCPAQIRAGKAGITWGVFLNMVKNNGKTNTPSQLKTIDQLAQEVIEGKHGNGDARKRSLGSRYNDVQARVDKLLKAGTVKPKPVAKPKPKPKPSAEAVAKEILRGRSKWGNNPERKQRLQAAGYNYNEVQGIINRLANATPKQVKAGQRVVLSTSAYKYVTGETIPGSIKGKTYTVYQLGMSGNRQKALLKEIMSWVYVSDIN